MLKKPCLYLSTGFFMLFLGLFGPFVHTLHSQGLQEGCGGDAINTAIGCISINTPEAFTSDILTWGIGIGGGIAFILILFAAFEIMTSSGDPKRLQAGQELLTAAVSGLLFIIFSVFLLRIIGVDILGVFT